MTETVTILGAGVWGSALAKLALQQGHLVRLWSRRSVLSLEEAAANADVLLSAISMKGVAETVAKLQNLSLIHI